jgi:hypothetical protein
LGKEKQADDEINSYHGAKQGKVQIKPTPSMGIDRMFSKDSLGYIKKYMAVQ